MVATRNNSRSIVVYRDESGSALVQTAFATIFMTFLFFTIANFGYLQYSTSTLQAHIQGAALRTNSALVASSNNPTQTLKQGILSEACALDGRYLEVSNVKITNESTELDAAVRANHNSIKTLHQDRQITNIEADISYDVPLLFNIALSPHCTLLYHLDANKVTFSQVEIVCS